MALKAVSNFNYFRQFNRHSNLSQFITRLSYSTSQKVIKEDKTPLGIEIEGIIKSGGPISLHQYVSLCNTHPKYGYYNAPHAIGPKGSFVTSPEISQLFGEMVALWLYTQWESNGSPQKLRLAEFGPGNGTLMSDILRTLKRFPKMFTCIEAVDLVETSQTLALKQGQSWVNPQLSEIDFGSPIEHPQYKAKFTWHNQMSELYSKCYEDKDTFTILIAHEFLDALPIRRFTKSDFGWRETLVDIDSAEDSPYHFKLLQAQKQTKGNLILSPLQHLYNHFPKDYQIELSSDLLQFLPQLFNLISTKDNRRGGLGLIVDYGDNLVKGDSLRGIKDHKFCNILSTPGTVDLSSDVNFQLIRQLAQLDQLYPRDNNHPIFIHGPQYQKDFLHKMGIQYRLAQVAQKLQPTPEGEKIKSDLIKGYKRLCDPMDMGKLFKFMAITNQRPPPLTFE